MSIEKVRVNEKFRRFYLHFPKKECMPFGVCSSWTTTPSAVADAGRTMKSVNVFMGDCTISGADAGRNMKPQTAFMGDCTISGADAGRNMKPQTAFMGRCGRSYYMNNRYRLKNIAFSHNILVSAKFKQFFQNCTQITPKMGLWL